MLKFSFYQIILIGAILLVFGTGVWFWAKKSLFAKSTAENTTIMLEKIKTVTKLISVEGQFSEMFDYKESYEYDFLNLFSKKIILRVTAKVSVGYDFEKVNISVDSINKTVTLNELPQPEVLSIDHDLDYYDITQGTFNKFTTDEYNMINKKAKESIAAKAKSND
ncbi:MAG: DUF4230 domain-containing protein, partial [Saprospiraceae bacterium]|nr:DUF4230 domain-containing protein [Saprospiraceae bacterium]